MYDDLPVLPEEPFSVIAERVRDAIQQDDPDMLTWDHSRIIDAEIMDMLFNSDGSPKEGVAVRWHGYFARWLMLYRPEWLSSQSANTEPAVTYWTVYLQLRAHVPQEQMPGAAPWEWNNTRPNWLD